MKWFKHDTDARNDPRIQRYMEMHPRNQIEAYGAYFIILEIVAEQIDETGNCAVEYPLRTWVRLSGLSAQKFAKYVNSLQTVGALSANFVQTSCKLSIPKLLKKRDNHSKNLQAKSKSKSKELDKDTTLLSAHENSPPDSLFLKLQQIINSPTPLDMSLVRKWQANGASDELIEETIRRLMAKRTGDPPRSMKYFENAIADAMHNLTQPMPKGQTYAKPSNHYSQPSRNAFLAGLSEFASQG